MENSPSGLWRTLGKRVGVTASRVRISYSPPGLEPRKPLESFGFWGSFFSTPFSGSFQIPSECFFRWPRFFESSRIASLACTGRHPGKSLIVMLRFIGASLWSQ